MKDLSIQYTEALDKATQDLMEKDVVAYEVSHGIDVNYKKFSLVMKKGEDIIGILNAFTAFSEIYIDDMWIHSSHRGKGYGKSLIQELENQFERKGFNNINLVTSAFQAPDFYKKCGFTLEFIRKNKSNPQLTKYFFVKFFKDQNQHQGIL
jgi:ribosomal protein S18 acetylase RimI-like enzyme